MKKKCPFCGEYAHNLNKSVGGMHAVCGSCGATFSITLEIKYPTDDETKSDDAKAAQILFDKAQVDLNRRHYRFAVHRLTAASKKDPTRIDIMMALGAVCSRQNMLYEALAAYKLALTMEPENKNVLLRSGMLFVQQKSYREAKKVFKSLLSLDPENHQAKLMLAIAEDRSKALLYDAKRKKAPTSNEYRGVSDIIAMIMSARLKSWAGSMLWPLGFILLLTSYQYISGTEIAPSAWMAALLLYVILFSIVIHELSHGMTAYLLGDDTASSWGRLTLNPLNHLSLVGTFIVPALMYTLVNFAIGWAKPVPFEPMALKRYPRDLALVTGAGPISNIVLSVLFFIIFSVVVTIDPVFRETFFASLMSGSPVTNMILPGAIETSQLLIVTGYVSLTGAVANVFIAALNLIPLAPLDGGWLLQSIVPTKLGRVVARLWWLTPFILIALFYYELLLYIFYPAVIAFLLYANILSAALP